MHTTSPPFRIGQESNTTTQVEGSGPVMDKTEGQEEDEPSGCSGSATTNTTKTVFPVSISNNKKARTSPHRRVLLNNVICNISRDFTLLTFQDVYSLLMESLFNTEETSLIVNKFICNVESPYQFGLSASAQKVLSEPNAGGASEFSEAVSYEIIHRLLGAELMKTEMAIEYQWEEWSKKTDYTIRLNNTTIAVSVTRAMKFHGLFKESDAFNLLYKKLAGIQLSNRDVIQKDRWEKQVLHILTEHEYIVNLLREVYRWMYERTPELIGNTVVLITHTRNAPFLYYNFCAEQSQMKFQNESEVEIEDVTSEQENTSTTTTDSVETSEEESMSFLQFDQLHNAAEDNKSSKSSSPFFYGYSTREEAELHGAVAEPILEIGEEQIWDAEGVMLGGSKEGLLHQPQPLSPLSPLSPKEKYSCDEKPFEHQKKSKLMHLSHEDALILDRLQKYQAPSTGVAGTINNNIQAYPCQIEGEERDPKLQTPLPASSPSSTSSSSSSSNISASIPFIPTHDELQFPPQRETLFKKFKRTFHREDETAATTATMEEKASLQDEIASLSRCSRLSSRSAAVHASSLPDFMYHPWSVSSMRVDLEEEEKVNELGERVVEKEKPGEYIGFAKMFEGGGGEY